MIKIRKKSKKQKNDPQTSNQFCVCVSTTDVWSDGRSLSRMQLPVYVSSTISTSSIFLTSFLHDGTITAEKIKAALEVITVNAKALQLTHKVSFGAPTSDSHLTHDLVVSFFKGCEKQTRIVTSTCCILHGNCGPSAWRMLYFLFFLPHWVSGGNFASFPLRLSLSLSFSLSLSLSHSLRSHFGPSQYGSRRLVWPQFSMALLEIHLSRADSLRCDVCQKWSVAGVQLYKDICHFSECTDISRQLTCTSYPHGRVQNAEHGWKKVVSPFFSGVRDFFKS